MPDTQHQSESDPPQEDRPLKLADLGVEWAVAIPHEEIARLRGQALQPTEELPGLALGLVDALIEHVKWWDPANPHALKERDWIRKRIEAQEVVPGIMAELRTRLAMLAWAGRFIRWLDQFVGRTGPMRSSDMPTVDNLVTWRRFLANGFGVPEPEPAKPVSESAAGGAEGQGGQLPPARHSCDFISVHWYGTDYTFTPNQANCVEELWKAWTNGTPEVADGTLVQKAGLGDNQRLRDVFKGHPAWRTMIVRGERRGAVRLSPPTEKN